MADEKKYPNELERKNDAIKNPEPEEKIDNSPELSNKTEKEGSKIEKINSEPKEKIDEKINKLKEGVSGPERTGSTSIIGGQSPISEARKKEIEKVLEEDLGEAYLSMSANKQKEFKIKGEETAKKINTILEKTKYKARQIIELIRSWLLTIPGVNKFFLEQETKIKTDKILEIKNKE